MFEGGGRVERCELCRTHSSTTYQRPWPSLRQPEVSVGSGQLAGRAVTVDVDEAVAAAPFRVQAPA